MSDANWYVRDKGLKRGPFPQEKLLLMYRRGQVNGFHDISQDGRTWIKAATLFDEPEPPPLLEPVANTSRSLTIDAYAAPPAEASPWPIAHGPDERIAGDRYHSRSKAAPTQRLALLAIPFVLGAIALTGLTFWLTRGRDAGFPGVGGRAGLIRSLDDDGGEISEAVGLVVVGIEHATPDGKHGVRGLSSGSAFAVTPDGYFLTNRHVVEFFDQMDNADGLQNRRDVLINKVFEDASKRLPKEVVAKLVAQSDFMRYHKIIPKVWIVTVDKGGRKVVREAKLEFKTDPNEPDLAILKVERTSGPFFRLSSGAQKVKPGSSVVALGFPGVARSPGSTEEEIEDELRAALATRVDSLFKDRDYLYTRTSGEVSREYKERNGTMWIDHDAKINHGNSGGPLVDSSGLVLGLNTQGNMAQRTYQALSVGQLRQDYIERRVRAIFADR